MHEEVLNVAQLEPLPLIKQFKRECHLVGGVAFALVLAGSAWASAVSVVETGGVPRFAIDGKPMAATAVMPSPAGKPGAAFRQLKAFREAGAHVWMETDDVFAAGRGYVMVHAASDGEKVVHLPCACDVREIFGASPARNCATVITEKMKRGETRVYTTNREGRSVESGS